MDSDSSDTMEVIPSLEEIQALHNQAKEALKLIGIDRLDRFNLPTGWFIYWNFNASKYRVWFFSKTR